MSSDVVMLASTLIDAGQPTRAIDVLAPALSGSPNDPDLLRLMSIACLNAGRTADAVRLAEAALSVEPGDDRSLRTLIRALAEHGSVSRSLQLARQLARRYPDDPRTLILFADVAATGRDRSRSSIKIARRGVVLAPNDPSAHHALGRLWMARHEPRRARREFEAAVRLDPMHEPARHNLALIRSGSNLLAGVRDLLDLARSSTDREREARAIAGLLTAFIYIAALGSIFAASLVPIFLTDAPGHTVARWVLAVAAVLAPAAIAAWFQHRTGPRSAGIFGDLARRRPLAVIAAGIACLSPVAWVAAAVDPSSSGAWYGLAMAPGALAMLLCVGMGLANSYRRR